MALNKQMNAHQKAVLNACGVLYRHGLKIVHMPIAHSAFDLLVSGSVRLEIKTCETSRKTSGDFDVWFYNIHRHGKLDTSAVDFYALYMPPLKNLGFRNGFWIVIPSSEITGKTISISPRSLIVKFAKWVNAWGPVVTMAKTSNKQIQYAQVA